MKISDTLAFIAQPTQTIANALGEFNHIPNSSDGVDGAAKLFQEVFNSRDKVEQIPLLNDVDVTVVPSGSLVRFRCMIQDNGLDQQIYQCYYPVKDAETSELKWKVVKYTDAAPANATPLPHEIHHNLQTVLADRQPYYAVSVPAETKWAREEFSAAAPLPADYSDVEKHEVKKEDEALAKQRHPLGGEGNAAVLVVYTNESFSVNEVFEVVGILERADESEDDDMYLDDDPFSQLQTKLPPQTLVPRLHVINYRKLNCAGNPKCLDVDEAVKKLADVDPKTLRNQVIQKVAKAVGGDQLAAEYILLHFLSRIYQRDAALAVGNFPINLTGLSAQSTTQLVQLIDQLLPRAYYLPLELAKINAVPFMPRNSETQGLAAGLLQLAEGTQVVVDENKLGEGKVQGVGVLNLHALKSVVDFGKLPFAVFDSANDETTNSPQLVQNWMELPVNINVMIVGTTRSGIFPVECVVPVVAERGIEGALEELRIGGEKEDKVLEDMRLYLGIMREGSYNVPEEMVKYIETDFVTTRARQRQNNETLMSQEELIQLCAVARLVTLSHTTNTLTREYWNQAKQLEQRRRERVITLLPKPRPQQAAAGASVVAPVSAAN